MGIIKQSAIIILSNWGLLILGILVSVLIARAVGPEGVGILALLTAMVGILGSIGSLGLVDSFIYYYKKKIYTFEQIIPVQLFTTVFFTLAVLLIMILFSGEFIKIFFHGLESYQINLGWIFLALFTIPLALIFSVFNVILIVDNHLNLYTIRHIGAKLTNVVFILLLLYVLKLGITGVLFTNLLIYILPIAVLGVWLARRKMKIKFGFSKEVFLRLYRTGLRQYGVVLSSIITKRIAFFFIGFFLAVKFNGYYAIAFGLMMLLCEIPRSTMWPLVGNLTGEDKPGISIAQAIRILLPFMIVVSVIIGALAYPLIYLLYGKEFSLAVDAFKLLLPVVVASAVVIPGSAYYNSIGQPGRILFYLIPTVILYIILLIVLIPIININGAAIALSLKQIVLAIIYIFLLSKHTGIPVKKFLFFSRKDTKLVCELVKHKFAIIR